MSTAYTAPMTSMYASAPAAAPAYAMPMTTMVEQTVFPSSASMIATPAYLPSSASMIATPSYGYGGYSGASSMNGPFQFNATPQTGMVTGTTGMGTAATVPASTIQTGTVQ